MRDYTARLEARVRARNRVNQIAKELLPKLIEAARPFVGKKIIKADGSLTKEFYQAVRPLLPERTNYENAWFDRSSYALRFGLRGQGWCGEEYMTAERTIGVGRLDVQVLAEVFPGELDDARTDYTAEEVRSLRADWKAKQKAADDAHSKLHPFGEHDN